MTFLIRPGAPLDQAQMRALGLDMWRDAELLVQSRWDDFLAADRASRRSAFAAYVAALDAEAAAADELAHSHSDLAEAA
jgi:tRNA(Leu) C34 or U34 (ribose-2'-O)-methylase TrmL